MIHTMQKLLSALLPLRNDPKRNHEDQDQKPSPLLPLPSVGGEQGFSKTGDGVLTSDDRAFKSLNKRRAALIEAARFGDDGEPMNKAARRLERELEREHSRNDRVRTLGEEVAARLDAGHQTVVIEAVADEDADFVPADRLLPPFGEPMGPQGVQLVAGTERIEGVVTLRPGDSYPVEAGAVISHPAGLIVRVTHADGRIVTINPVLR